MVYGLESNRTLIVIWKKKKNCVIYCNYSFSSALCGKYALRLIIYYTVAAYIMCLNYNISIRQIITRLK